MMTNTLQLSQLLDCLYINSADQSFTLCMHNLFGRGFQGQHQNIAKWISSITPRKPCIKCNYI